MKAGIVMKLSAVLVIMGLSAGSLAAYAAPGCSSAEEAATVAPIASRPQSTGSVAYASPGFSNAEEAAAMAAMTARPPSGNSASDNTPERARFLNAATGADADAGPEPFAFRGGPKGSGAGVKLRIGIPLDQLVTDGVIDQKTADAIGAFLEQKALDARAEMDKAKDMTPEEARSYFAGFPRPDVFAELVSGGILTQEQADAVKAALPDMKTGPGPEDGRKFACRIDVDEWVSNGLIDQAAADAIKAFVESGDFEAALRERKQNPPEEPGDPPVSGMYHSKADVMSVLVDKGLLTQDRADAVCAFMKQKIDGFKADRPESDGFKAERPESDAVRRGHGNRPGKAGSPAVPGTGPSPEETPETGKNV